MSYKELISKLELAPHIEGGYFRRTYISPQEHNGRPLMTSIFYLLTQDSPINHWHKNKSDILHFHMQGAPIRVLLINNDTAAFEEHILGQDVSKGENLQVLVPGNTWKGCYLLGAEYGLTSEAVSPGFSYEDMTLGD